MEDKKWTREDFFTHPVSDYPIASKIFVAIVIFILYIVCKIWTRFEIIDYKKIQELDRDEGLIFVANHASSLDPVILYVAHKISPKIRNKGIRFIYKSEFEDNSFLSFLVPQVGAIPVKRDSADTKALKRTVQALKRGEDAGVFPEGTRIKDPHGRNESHGGFALMAQMSKAKIVPVAIAGAWNLPWPVKVRVQYGEPFSLDDLDESLSKKEKHAYAESKAMTEIYDMRDKLTIQHKMA